VDTNLRVSLNSILAVSPEHGGPGVRGEGPAWGPGAGPEHPHLPGAGSPEPQGAAGPQTGNHGDKLITTETGSSPRR